MNHSPRTRWVLCWLLFCATALSFLDRQVLSVLAPALMKELSMDAVTYSRVVFAFVLSYTIMFSVGGRLMDLLGTRTGMALSVAIWSAASAAHALVGGAAGLGAVRFLLGFGEGGCFPGVTRAATEWFPPEKRVLAIGIANGGSAFGAVIAPPLAVRLAGEYGWRGAFLAVGLLGFLWLVVWLVAARHEPAFSWTRENKIETVPLRILLSDRLVWRVMVSRFLFDPVFYFYMFWIPQYLTRQRGLSLGQIGSYFWIPFLVLGLSTIASGRLSDALVEHGWSAHRTRATLLVAAATLTPVSWLAAGTPSVAWAITLMAGLMLAHGLWISNFLGFLSDNFPVGAMATVTGLSGTAGGIGGMLSTLVIGAVVNRYSFAPVFAVSGIRYPVAAVVLLSRVARGAASGLDETRP